MQRIILLFFLLLQFSAGTSTAADQDTIIGILSFQPKTETVKLWQGMVDHLNHSGSDSRFVILPLKQNELEQAVSRHNLDFVLTNPSHYIYMRHYYGLSAPLLTLVRGSKQKELDAFGGTIFTLSQRTDINNLSDLKNCTIALPFRHAFGACQMQEYELFRQKLPLLRDEQLLLTGLPHIKTVEAVLDGRADVGFARAGIIERMAVTGHIQLSNLKIINQQKMPDFPCRLSTHLYPEWPLAALLHTSTKTQKHLLASLLNLPDKVSGQLPFGICGFAPPANYQEVNELLKALRAPPFANPPDFRLSDLWNRYSNIIISFAVSLTFILFLLARLSVKNKLLAETGKELAEKSNSLQTLTEELESRILKETSKLKKQELILIQQTKLAAMGEMIGTIAHQWRQPLNTLGLCLQNLKDADTFQELTRDYLDKTTQKAMDQIQMMSRTIDDFRNFFRIQKNRTVFDAMEVVGQVLNLVAPQLENQRISWRLICTTHQRSFFRVEDVIACAEKRIEGYRNEFEHVILNLINNAREAIIDKREQTDSEGKLAIIFSNQEDRVIIKVQDNGIGIPPDLRDRIFEPYFTTKTQAQGTGLGLYLCKVIIEDHMQGQLMLESATATGTCFTINLPRAEGAQ